MRILYLITSTNVGGTERALLELINRIDRNKYNAYVCSVKKPGAFANKIAEAADGFYSLGLSEAGGIKAATTFLPALFRLILIIRRTRPFIIHSFLFRANILGRIAGRLTGVPAVISSIRVIEADKHYKHFIDRITSSMVSMYIAVSNAARKFTIKNVGVCPDKIVTVYNGIECRSKQVKPPDSFLTDNNYRNIALVGRLDRQKGHNVLIEAVKAVLPKQPDLRVYFFGEGPCEFFLRQTVKKENLSEHIIFMDVTENIRSWISEMDIIVLPSLWEGLPNVLLEAMAEARPVVASRIAGIDEIVVDGTTGILFDPENPQSLAQALLGILNNKPLALNMGREGKKRVLEKFSMEKMSKKTMGVYQKLYSMNN